MKATSPVSEADFSLTVSPVTVNLVAGGDAQKISVSAAAIQGFSGTVNVAISGLPAGITASPSTLMLNAGTAQTVTLTAAANVVADTVTISFTGTSGNLTHTAAMALTVTAAAPLPPAADFSLTVSPAVLTITDGAAGQSIAITANAVNGFSGTVDVALTGLPSGVSASPSMLTLTPGAAQSVKLTAAGSAKTGTVAVTFTGTSGNLIHATALALTVTAEAPLPPAADFSLTVSPAVLTITDGAAGQSIAIIANAVNGFSGTVDVALTGLPSGVSASPSMLTLTPGAAQSVKLTAAESAKAGTVTVTVTGTSGSLIHTISLPLTVAAAAPAGDFSLSISPASLSLTDDGTVQAVMVTANAVNGFAGTISVNVSGLPGGVTASPSTLTLAPGVAQSVIFTAASSSANSTETVTFTGTSGSLSHTATLALTVTAAVEKDFSLTISPVTLALIAGAAGQPVSVTANGLNGFTSVVNVALSGLPGGVTAAPSTLMLTPGTAQSVTLTAASSAATATATVTFTGTSGSLTHTATLALTVSGAVQSSGYDVTTYHYDNARDGLNSHETTLTPANVNSTQFGKIGFYTTDGVVDATSLYLSALTVNGQVHNVLYVETEHDSVYAFDADTSAQLWKTTVLGAGETTSDDRNCAQISPEIGITATPVIDRAHGANGAIFLVGMSKDASGNYHHRLHGLDLTTGAEIGGSPMEIQATYRGTGTYSSNGSQIFEPGQYAERAGLLLMNGTIYMGWTSHCDVPPYTGWLMGYSEQLLQQTSVLNLTPNSGEAGASEEGEGAIWMSGAGLAGDTSGNIYFLDANGAFDTTLSANGFPAAGDYGNAFMKVSTTGGTLTVADYFNQYNTISESYLDTDLGSGGALLLPDVTDASGQVHHLAVGAGKDSNVYIVDRDNMGKFNANNNNAIYQELQGGLGGGVWGMPAYFNGTLYYGGNGDVLRAFTMTSAKFQTSPSSQSATPFAFPGTTPSVSANGTQNGIVWAVEASSATGVLHAYDATSLNRELYNSSQAAGGRDSFEDNKFITPVVVNGKVYVGTTTGVVVLGLLPQ